MTLVYLGLGSNLGDREENIRAAVDALQAVGLELVALSSFRETVAVGPPQPDYINAAVAMRTHLTPDSLLTTVKQIETDLGRTPSERWGARVIDIDILLYGDLMMESEELTIPHPELTHRGFVVVPLLELDPNLELPSGEPLSVFAPR